MKLTSLQLSDITSARYTAPATKVKTPPVLTHGVDSVQFGATRRTIPKAQMFVNGAFVPSSSGATIDVLNPTNRKIIARVAEANATDIDKAVQAAREAAPAWAAKTPAERAVVLDAIADQILLHKEELATLEAQNNGKPIGEAREDMDYSAMWFKHYAQEARDDKPKKVVTPEGDLADSEIRHLPLGVAGQIIPWNYPLMMAAWKLAPSMAAGCTSVIKAAEQTPLSLLKLAEYLKDAKVPDGVLNIVTGRGLPTGKALAEHPDLDILSFTGSTEVGRHIAMAAASKPKGPIPTILELGGKSPNVVFADADLDRAVNGALFGIMINQGQVCSAGSRILVQRPIYEAFVARIGEKASKNIPQGDPMNPATKMGPQISKIQQRRILEYIELGKREGFRLIAGGGKPTDPSLAKGNFVLPTLFADVDPNSRLAQEEIFGPVGVIIPFDTEADAIRLANGTSYGLAAAVWTKDADRMERMKSAVKSGIFWGNTSQPAYPQGSWGGVKGSGVGHDDMRAYQYKQWVHVAKHDMFADGQPLDWYPDPPKA
jgi:betaine-aldehyde dehydrogenase